MDDLKDKGSIKISSHILIRDKNTEQVILNKNCGSSKLLKEKHISIDVEKKDE